MENTYCTILGKRPVYTESDSWSKETLPKHTRTQRNFRTDSTLNIKLPVNGEEEQLWSIIQAYSPTEPLRKEDITKVERFYEDLQLTTANAHKNIIVMGDFNGQIGKQKNGEDYTI
ncbi:hypothetical protein EVAR_41210_1 [Eumeta japonica]|uniref:Craniofacial development protein 2 n=1 Tax=Eumeta variegata TaxID=151549 RepID=A0A4C1W5V5_EUMVA|nr:hypothetical protein EVAR_41210_1 [Eumeta japonica]